MDTRSPSLNSLWASSQASSRTAMAIYSWKYAGCSLEQLTGCGWQTVIHPDDMTKFNSEWSASPAAEKPFETEARMRRADGHYHWFSIRNGPAVSETRSSKASLRTLIAFEDINERKEAQVKL